MTCGVTVTSPNIALYDGAELAAPDRAMGVPDPPNGVRSATRQ
jgi:hypothetical protein